MPEKNIKLHYGEELMTITVPTDKLAWIASPNRIKPVRDITQEITQALDNPIGMPPLKELIRGGSMKTVIITDDFTRPTPTKVILPELISRLKAAGINEEDITILLALGTHRYMTDAEIKTKLGEDVPENVRVVNHCWKDPDQLVYFGKSFSGIPIYINKIYNECELSIAIGNIVPHIYAGWSGGAKMVQPGISGPQTTAHTHLIAAKQLIGIVGKVDNPVRQEMEQIAKDTGLTMTINTVMNPDGSLVKIFAGDPIKAHREGVSVAESIFTKEITDFPDLVIVSAYPADCDLWQSTKAMTVGALCAKKGGQIILFTPSPEGDCPGHPDFVGLGALPPDEVFQMTQKGLVEDVVAASVNMTVGAVRERTTVIVVTEERNKPYIEKLGLTYAPTFNAAMKLAKGGSDSINSIGIITHGADFAPKFTQ